MGVRNERNEISTGPELVETVVQVDQLIVPRRFRVRIVPESCSGSNRQSEACSISYEAGALSVQLDKLENGSVDARHIDDKEINSAEGGTFRIWAEEEFGFIF